MTPLIRELLICRNTLLIWWYTFKRDTSLPMSPYLPEIVLTINKLESERKS